jgi:hypothetical protein
MNTKEEVIPVVGMGVTEYVGSDRYSYTIVEVITPRKIVVQPDSCVRTDKNGLSEIQEYTYTSCPDASKTIVTKRKNGRWVQVGEPMVGGRGFGVGYRKAYQDPSF